MRHVRIRITKASFNSTGTSIHGVSLHLFDHQDAFSKGAEHLDTCTIFVRHLPLTSVSFGGRAARAPGCGCLVRSYRSAVVLRSSLASCGSPHLPGRRRHTHISGQYYRKSAPCVSVIFAAIPPVTNREIKGCGKTYSGGSDVT